MSLRLYERTPYSKITMDAIARGAKLSKGAVYLYFTTKDELFLALLREMLGAWFAAVDAGLHGSEGPLTAAELLGILTKTLGARDALSRLLVEGAAFESNVSLEAVTEHKRWLWGRLITTGAKLEARFLPLQANEGFRLLLHLYAMMAGMSQLTRTSPVVEKALRLADLDPLRFPFEGELNFLFSCYLTGLEHRMERASPRLPAAKDAPASRGRRAARLKLER